MEQEYNDLWKLKYREILDRLTDPKAELFKAMQVDQKASDDDSRGLGRPARLAAEKRLNTLRERYESLRKKKHDQLLALSDKG